jgi:hypothetical protein
MAGRQAKAGAPRRRQALHHADSAQQAEAKRLVNWARFCWRAQKLVASCISHGLIEPAHRLKTLNKGKLTPMQTDPKSFSHFVELSRTRGAMEA